MKDQYGREIDYMRISITDRCNLRCRYCMPDGIQAVPMSEILSYEEIVKVVKAAAKTGIKKIKITGGEPLVRPDCAKLVQMVKIVPGIEQVTMTTNGVLLESNLEQLLEAGLDAVNISLDTLKSEVYQQITGKDELQKVFDGIEAAVQAGIRTKINVVLQRGMNDTEWKDMSELAKKYPICVRFIEMMPIGFGKEFEPISNQYLIEQLQEIYGDVQMDSEIHGNGPAVYYKVPGFQGSIGFISAIHGKFCGNCNRIRMTSVGKLKLCLCYDESVDVREILRNGEEDKLQQAIEKAIYRKPKQHCFEEFEEITEDRRMVEIGG